MSDRTCSLENCNKIHRARGYCAAHYNSVYAGGKYHAKQPTPCHVCGVMVMRRQDNNYRATCSLACLHELMQWSTTAPDEWARMTLQRAREAGATIIERVERLEVFERDDWTCYLCGSRVALGASCYTPLSATVDHVVPLSKGGTHTLSNVATCCFLCNSTKQASLSVA